MFFIMDSIFSTKKFDFERKRGIVWVCDLTGSSKYLNDNSSAEKLEAFLPRLHWISTIIVEAAGGHFIKWTGDGFLAWFETPLHRQIGIQASAVFEALWYLTFIVNITQLGIESERKFLIRHGVTYEHDALLTKITYEDGHTSIDLIGRAVVLAFRLSSVRVHFPFVITQKEIVTAYRKEDFPLISFKKWNPTRDDSLRYFKNERWGINTLFSPCDHMNKKAKSLPSLIKQSKRVIAEAEGVKKPRRPDSAFIKLFFERLIAGPEWCQGIEANLIDFLRNDFLETLKISVDFLEQNK